MFFELPLNTCLQLLFMFSSELKLVDPINEDNSKLTAMHELDVATNAEQI